MMRRHIEALLGAAADGDVVAALSVVMRLADEGRPVDRLLEELVVPVQTRVGELWESDVWSVAQEHAATAVIDAVVGQLDLLGDRPDSPLGCVVVVCVEGDWHAMPGRLAATGLRCRGWDVRFLGPSVPASHLQRSLNDTWDAALLLCSVPMYLPGALRSIAAMHAAGLPVLASGRGFGPDALRATRLGADAWAPDLEAGASLLLDWRHRPPDLAAAVTPDAEVFRFEAWIPDLVSDALERLQATWPAVQTYPDQQLARTREDLDYLLRFVHASTLTGDERILADYLGWAQRVLGSRGVPPEALLAGVRAVQAALPDTLPRAGKLLRTVADPLLATD